jgi:hypothetical protein
MSQLMDNIRVQALVESIRKDVRDLAVFGSAFEQYYAAQGEFEKRTEVMTTIAKNLAKKGRNPKPYLAEAAMFEAARKVHTEQHIEDEVRRRYDQRYDRREPIVRRGRGRPPVGEKPMTSTERNRRSRASRATKIATKIPVPSPNDDLIQDQCLDCETPEQFWQTSLSNAAGDAIAMRAYWTRQFGDWQIFEVPTTLVTLVKQAAAEWLELAKTLERRTT